MIALRDVTARRAPRNLEKTTVSLGAGVHAALGRDEDGVPLFLALLAAAVPCRSGSATLEGDAVGSRAARQKTAYVPEDATLPDGLRVDEAFALASRLRGEPVTKADARLAVLGLESLRKRPVRSLSREERRSVALAEALSSTRVRLVLVDEPRVGIDPRASMFLASAFRARADAGVAIVFSTASPRDAEALGTTMLVFDRGTLVATVRANDARALARSQAARMRIAVDDARRLLAALARETVLATIAVEGASVVVSGPSLEEVAAAVGRAVRLAAVDVRELRPEPASLDELRAAIAGDAAGAYRAAFDKAYARESGPGARTNEVRKEATP